MLYKDKVTGLYFRVELILEGIATIRRIPDGLLYRIPSYLINREFEAVNEKEFNIKKILKSKDREWLDRLVNLLMPQVSNTVRLDFSKLDDVEESKESKPSSKKKKKVKTQREDKQKLAVVKPKRTISKKEKINTNSLIKVSDIAAELGVGGSKVRRVLRKLDLPKPYEWSEEEKDNIIRKVENNL